MIKDKYIKNAFISFLFLGFLMLILFLISNSQAQQPPQGGSNTSTGIRAINTTPKTQKVLYFGPTNQISSSITNLSGSLNNSSDPNNSCGGLPPNNYVLMTYTQNTSQSFTNYDYKYYDIKAGVIWGVKGDTATNVLYQPSTYDLQCWVNQPQVDWRTPP